MRNSTWCSTIYCNGRSSLSGAVFLVHYHWSIPGPVSLVLYHLYYIPGPGALILDTWSCILGPVSRSMHRVSLQPVSVVLDLWSCITGLYPWSV